MAIASKWQGERFGADLFDFDVYALAGDGCLMEGVSHESASLAGHLKLDNLCWMYDNNHITIDGDTALAYGDDVLSRFEGYGWNVVRVGDANDASLLARAFEAFKAETGRPTLIVIDSHIGWGSPNKQDTESAHGEPLGEEEVKLTKRAYGWPEDAQFLVPEGVRERFDEVLGKRGAAESSAWREKLAASPHAETVETMQRRRLPEGWDSAIPSFEADEEKGLATRKASNKVENAIGEKVPWLIAGSADLTDSTSVRLTFDGAENLEPESFGGRQIHFGIREHAAATACNGMSLCKLRPLWSTYLTFSDYGRPGIRLSALMELPVIHLFTHDSIGLGEDGPTHQPIEQLASLRAMPHLDVMRPADANEVAEAWRIAIERTHNPIALVITRQTVPVFDRSKYASAAGVRRGGYVLADCEGEPELILIATGSEVFLALGAHETLAAEGIRSRVVSLPCWEIFDRQEASYRDEVLPPADRPGGDRGGLDARLGALRRQRRDDRRHAHLRPVGALQGRRGGVRLHPREDRRGRSRRGRGRWESEGWSDGGGAMKATARLHELGQSLWLDNITRPMLAEGMLQGYIDELSVTGLTSNPTIFDKAIGAGDAYDEQIAEVSDAAESGEGVGDNSDEKVFFELAVADLRDATDLFAGVHERTDGVDGWASLEVSPLLADDTAATIEQAAALHAKAERRNLFIKIPGTEAGLGAIEESIFAGIPINVTLLFDDKQYLAAADAYMKGVERRIEAGLDPNVASVASLFISRWDVAVAEEAPAELVNRLGDRDRRPRLPRLPRAARLRPHAAPAQRGRPRPAPALGQHRDQGPRRLRHPLRRSAGLPVHGQHDAGADPGRFLPARRGRRPAGQGRRQRRGGAERVRRCRDRRRRTRRPPPGGGQGELRQVLGRAALLDPVEARGRHRVTPSPLRELPAWAALQAHHEQIEGTHLRDLFAADGERGERLVAEAAGLHLDFSKNRITDETLLLLGELARERGVAERREAMFAGEHINVSEDRAVLHVALRMPRSRSLVVDGVDVVKEVHETLDRMGAFAERVRSGEWLGHTGKPIRDVVNVGIGGSDLGPVMAYEALRHYSHREIDLPLRLQRRRHRLRRGDPRPRPRADAVRDLLEDLHDAGDDDQREERPRLGARPRSAATSRRSPSTSSPSPPTPRASPGSGSTPRTCSASGSGSGAATRWTRRSGSRRCWRSAPPGSPRCWPASTRSTSTSRRRRPVPTCRC